MPKRRSRYGDTCGKLLTGISEGDVDVDEDDVDADADANVDVDADANVAKVVEVVEGRDEERCASLDASWSRARRCVCTESKWSRYRSEMTRQTSRARVATRDSSTATAGP